MSDSRVENTEIILNDAIQSSRAQLERINGIFHKSISFAANQSRMMDIQRQIGLGIKQSGRMDIQRQIDLGIKQSSMMDIQRKFRLGIKQSGRMDIQRQIGLGIRQVGRMDIQRQIGLSIKQSGMMDIQRQIQGMYGLLIDGIDWDAFMEEGHTRLDEESNRLHGLLSREYQSLNALLLQLQDFFEILNKKSPILFLVLSLFVWKPITDSLSDAIRDVTRTIITEGHNATFGDKNMRSKIVRKEVASELSGVDPLFVDAIRIILKPELELRAKATRQSKVVTTLILGQKVRFIETRGDWTQIESYDAATDTRHSGWVYTRYLARVEK